MFLIKKQCGRKVVCHRLCPVCMIYTLYMAFDAGLSGQPYIKHIVLKGVFMKSSLKAIWVIALVAVIGFSFAACSSDSDSDSGTDDGGPAIVTANPETDFEVTHDFGYPCTMPEYIYIDDFRVLDGSLLYEGVELVSYPKLTSASLEGSNKYTLTDTIFIRKFSSESGRKWRFTNNILRNNITVEENLWPK